MEDLPKIFPKSATAQSFIILTAFKLKHSHTGLVIKIQEARANLLAIPVSIQIIELSCVHTATNWVILSRTILLCAAEIKHAQA